MDHSSELEREPLVEDLGGPVPVAEIDDKRMCKAGPPARSSSCPQTTCQVEKTSSVKIKSPPCVLPPDPCAGLEKGDAKSCSRPQPPPPPLGGQAVVIPIPPTHRIGRPVPLIVEPDYVRRENPERYIIAQPEPLRVRSREIIASHMYHGCHCGKRNGLQDNCRRWDCRGFPYCCANGLCQPSGGTGCDGKKCRKG